MPDTSFWHMIDKVVAVHAKFCCHGRERLCPYHEGMVAGLKLGLEASEKALDRCNWFEDGPALIDGDVVSE